MLQPVGNGEESENHSRPGQCQDHKRPLTWSADFRPRNGSRKKCRPGKQPYEDESPERQERKRPENRRFPLAQKTQKLFAHEKKVEEAAILRRRPANARARLISRIKNRRQQVQRPPLGVSRGREGKTAITIPIGKATPIRLLHMNAPAVADIEEQGAAPRMLRIQIPVDKCIHRKRNEQNQPDVVQCFARKNVGACGEAALRPGNQGCPFARQDAGQSA